MAKEKKATEHDVLRLFVSEMDARGVNRKMITIDVDEAARDLMREKFKLNATLEEIRQLTDKCLANEWVEHTSLGSGHYAGLSLTTVGHGAIRSLEAKEKAKAKRSNLKKASDYIEDHKGLFVALGALIALAGVLSRIGG